MARRCVYIGSIYGGRMLRMSRQVVPLLCPRLCSTQHGIQIELPQNGNQAETGKIERHFNNENALWNGIEQISSMERNLDEGEVPISEQRSLRAAVIGTPNAGKSTLINQLLQNKVLAASPKVHTTSRRAAGIFTEGNSQVVLIDTPGIVSNKYARSLRMSREFTADPIRSVMEADIVMVVVDAANKFTREKLGIDVLRILRQHPHLPSILILNKVDIVTKKPILLRLAEVLTGSSDSHADKMGHLVRRWRDRRVPTAEKKWIKEELDALKAELDDKKQQKRRVLEHLMGKARSAVEKNADSAVVNSADSAMGNADSAVLNTDSALVPMDHWPFFGEVFMVSALDGNGIEKIKQHLISSCKPREWEYTVSEVTDQPALNLVQDVIREKICLHTDKEIPYVVRQENVIWERGEDGVLSIYQYLHCGKKSRAAILVGRKGEMISTIREEAKSSLEELLRCPVELTLHVKK